MGHLPVLRRPADLVNPTWPLADRIATSTPAPARGWTLGRTAVAAALSTTLIGLAYGLAAAWPW